MNNGKNVAVLPEQPPDNATKNKPIPAATLAPYLACARWLLQNPQVLEIWGMVSDLPQVSIPEASVTLDAGTWFLCRVALPPIEETPGEQDGVVAAPEVGEDALQNVILSFVRQV